MKIYIGGGRDGDLAALEHHILREGDTICEKHSEADFHVADNVFLPEGLGVDIPPDRSKDMRFYVTRVFDGQEFMQQWIVGVPFRTLFSMDLGAKKDVGSVLVSVNPSEELFESLSAQKFLTWLRDREYKGLLSWAFDQDRKVCGLCTGLPGFGLYALMEMLRQPIVSFLTSPTGIRECWSAAVLLSKAPWPFGTSVANDRIGPVTDDCEKHLWTFDRLDGSRSLTTRQGRIAVATAWSSESLNNVQKRILRTCFDLKFDEKQFRTDIVRHTWDVLEPLAGRGFLSIIPPVWS